MSQKRHIKPLNSQKPFDFAHILLTWNKNSNTRQMPWKGEKDPYKIWLSEIMLQQTRVEQGWGYYQRFLAQFPDIHRLAQASDEKVFKLWEGLGYYSRCRNLLTTARYISTELKGKFPDNYETITKLKGVGPYTAAAISSFAFNEAKAVVDGNVFRVLARIFGITTPIDSTEGKKQFTDLANELLDKKHPGAYNQAIMDFGAVICKPAPVCDQCPFQQHCYAWINNKIASLPVKSKKPNVKKRWFYYFLLRYKNKIAVYRRHEKDIWQNLYEFLLIEADGDESTELILKKAEQRWLTPENYEVKKVSPVFTQQLTHQFIKGRFFEISLKKIPASLSGEQWVSMDEIKNLAFPKFINQFLQNKQA